VSALCIPPCVPCFAQTPLVCCVVLLWRVCGDESSAHLHIPAFCFFAGHGVGLGARAPFGCVVGVFPLIRPYYAVSVCGWFTLVLGCTVSQKSRRVVSNAFSRVSGWWMSHSMPVSCSTRDRVLCCCFV